MHIQITVIDTEDFYGLKVQSNVPDRRLKELASIMTLEKDKDWTVLIMDRAYELAETIEYILRLEREN